MKAVLRRLSRLEQDGTQSPAALKSYRLATELWERRRVRLEAEGRPFEDAKPEFHPGSCLSVVETMRRCLEERRAAKRQAHEIAGGRD